MTTDRYHKAAKDGLLDVLREANRREVNAKDADGMTPVLWAAFEGKLDALRLLVARGGEPDKSDQFGNTALHLSAAKGHLHCVDFLVKFGVNLYSLDIDRHSAKDLAAINNRDNILMYLDAAAANLEQTDRKKAKTYKEQAEKQCEKRIKEYTKRQQKLDQTLLLDTETKPMPHRPSTVLTDWKHRIWSTSQGNLKPITKEPNAIANGTKFSALVGGGGGGTVSSTRGIVQRKAQAMRAIRQSNQSTQQQPTPHADEFKIAEIDSSGKRSVRSLQGLRRDSEVIYVGTFRGKIADVFNVDQSGDGGEDELSNVDNLHQKTMSRSISQPDFFSNKNPETDNEGDADEASEEVLMQRPSGLFDRPMFGSLAFRRSITAALNEFQQPDTESVGGSSAASAKQNGTSRPIKPRSQLVISDSESNGSCESDVEDRDDDTSTPLERFLSAWGLGEHIHIFQKQQIDLDTLMLLTESDLKSLGLPLGPFRKLVIAIQERKSALTNPGAINDSRL